MDVSLFIIVFNDFNTPLKGKNLSYSILELAYTNMSIRFLKVYRNYCNLELEEIKIY